MAFTKSHPQNSWEAEYIMAVGYANDSQAHLNALQAQLDEMDVKVSSAQTIIATLEPGTTRHELAEIADRKRHLSHLLRTKQLIQKSFNVVAARLKRHQESLAEFPMEELRKEQKLHKAKLNAGSSGRGPDRLNEARSLGPVESY